MLPYAAQENEVTTRSRCFRSRERTRQCHPNAGTRLPLRSGPCQSYGTTICFRVGASTSQAMVCLQSLSVRSMNSVLVNKNICRSASQKLLTPCLHWKCERSFRRPRVPDICVHLRVIVRLWSCCHSAVQRFFKYILERSAFSKP